MSFAAEMLAQAQLAYKNALNAQYTQFNGRRWASHEIDKLRKEVDHWQNKVNLEQAAANGDYSHVTGPLRFRL